MATPMAENGRLQHREVARSGRIRTAAGPAFASPAPGEPFLVTIAIEAALMAAVATTEELLFRGWIQINLQRAFQIHLGLRPARACAATAVASGLVFTFAHDSATTAASCCSLVLGSCTATLARPSDASTAAARLTGGVR